MTYQSFLNEVAAHSDSFLRWGFLFPKQTTEKDQVDEEESVQKEAVLKCSMTTFNEKEVKCILKTNRKEKSMEVTTDDYSTSGVSSLSSIEARNVNNENLKFCIYLPFIVHGFFSDKGILTLSTQKKDGLDNVSIDKYQLTIDLISPNPHPEDVVENIKKLLYLLNDYCHDKIDFLQNFNENQISSLIVQLNKEQEKSVTISKLRKVPINIESMTCVGEVLDLTFEPDIMIDAIGVINTDPGDSSSFFPQMDHTMKTKKPLDWRQNISSITMEENPHLSAFDPNSGYTYSRSDFGCYGSIYFSLVHKKKRVPRHRIPFGPIGIAKDIVTPVKILLNFLSGGFLTFPIKIESFSVFQQITFDKFDDVNNNNVTTMKTMTPPSKGSTKLNMTHDYITGGFDCLLNMYPEGWEISRTVKTEGSKHIKELHSYKSLLCTICVNPNKQDTACHPLYFSFSEKGGDEFIHFFVSIATEIKSTPWTEIESPIDELKKLADEVYMNSLEAINTLEESLGNEKLRDSIFYILTMLHHAENPEILINQTINNKNKLDNDLLKVLFDAAFENQNVINKQ